MANSFDIDPIVALALDKVKGKAFRDEVPPGTYDGVATVDVRYRLRVGDDYIQRNNPKVPWKALALCLASKVNDATLNAVLRIALDQDSGREGLESETKPRVDVAIAELVAITNSTHKGKVTGEVHVTQATVREIERESEVVTK